MVWWLVGFSGCSPLFGIRNTQNGGHIRRVLGRLEVDGELTEEFGTSIVVRD